MEVIPVDKLVPLKDKKPFRIEILESEFFRIQISWRIRVKCPLVKPSIGIDYD